MIDLTAKVADLVHTARLGDNIEIPGQCDIAAFHREQPQPRLGRLRFHKTYDDCVPPFRQA